MKKKIGIITFHNSYNCGSMLQTYALQHIVKNDLNLPCEVIDFSNEGQRELYSVFCKCCSLKNIVKNIVIAPHQKKIRNDFLSYEEFKNKNFLLTPKSYCKMEELSDQGYSHVITGSDQVWNITIDDADDAYFLPWVKTAKKVAYSPSFGAKDIKKYSDNPEKYREYLNNFYGLSVRENNGQRWIKELIGKEVPVLLDPTLLLSKEDYDEIASTKLKLPEKYIFYYSPGYQKDISRLVSKISKKYNLPVIAFNSKTFHTKGMNFLSDFKLPEIENPSTYLQLIKNAELVITTSFHGTVFSSIYKKKFWTVKNGGMFGDDDRVKTLIDTLHLNDRLTAIEFDDTFNYLCNVDYSKYDEIITREQEKSTKYLKEVLDIR